jgi:hypothetical protein
MHCPTDLRTVPASELTIAMILAEGLRRASKPIISTPRDKSHISQRGLLVARLLLHGFDLAALLLHSSQPAAPPPLWQAAISPCLSLSTSLLNEEASDSALPIGHTEGYRLQ